MALGSVIFDVDGTLAGTERDGHRIAFNRAFAKAGMPERWGYDAESSAEYYGGRRTPPGPSGCPPSSSTARCPGTTTGWCWRPLLKEVAP